MVPLLGSLPSPIKMFTRGFISSCLVCLVIRAVSCVFILLCIGVHQAEVILGSNTEGVEKVEEADGKYAFFMESASIQYLVERRCKLSQVWDSDQSLSNHNS